LVITSLFRLWERGHTVPLKPAGERREEEKEGS